MTYEDQNRQIVNNLDSVATEIADDLIAMDDEEAAMRALWRYQEVLHRALMKSGMRRAQASDICGKLKGRVLEALNRMRQSAH